MQADEIITPENSEEERAPIIQGLEIYSKAGAITSNFEAFEAYINKKIEPYQGADWTLDTYDNVKFAKAVRADLNRLYKQADEARKETKRQYMEPIRVFEERVKGVTDKIKAVTSEIGEHVSAYDKQERARRKQELKAHYLEVAGALAEAVDYEVIHEDSWLNKTCTDRMERLEKKLQQLYKDWQILLELVKDNPEAKAIEARFFTTLDLTDAIQYVKERKESEARLKALYSGLGVEEEQQDATPEPEPEPEPTPEPTSTEDAQQTGEHVFVWQLTFEASEADLTQALSYLRRLGLSGRAQKVGRVR